MNDLFALVDCNNFYVSCERVFNPALKHRPVVVLSNNDGCIIARSEEAKAIGIRMGQPVFECRSLIARHGVRVFSSNYSLYGDISRRIMDVLHLSCPEVEIYSIDEAFLDLTGLPDSPRDFCRDLRDRINKWVGVPVSIGIAAPSKTLAKIAKPGRQRKDPDCGACSISAATRTRSWPPPGWRTYGASAGDTPGSSGVTAYARPSI